ncbi:MAG: hypothetical protein JWO28_1806 [Hyphomicrobiales bacterium]|jgi:tripartite-type tricarboxylate transporter receptor subunit TctC|nr:hypothetical protein [Hyphomicrobiales bacterium]
MFHTTPLCIHRIWTAGLLLLAASGIAIAQPASDDRLPCQGNVVRYVIPYPPGSPIDVVVRRIALATVLGSQIIIDNKSGASGSIGATEVAKAAPDGCTVLATVQDPVVSNTALIAGLTYDVPRDFAFVTKLTASNPALIAHASVKANTLAELVDLAKKNPGTLKYGTFGVGSFPHIIVEAFAKKAGISLLHVPYRGPPQALQDIVTGAIDLTVGGIASGPLIDEGKLKPLAQIGTRRAWIRDTPTFAESGYGDLIFTTPIWVGLLVPAKTPKRAISKLATASRAAIEAPEVRKFLADLAFEPVGNSPEEFEAQWRAEFDSIPPLIRSLGITAQ